MKSDIQRPVLTMPEAEAAAMCDAFAQAGVILEYGSGGSTVIAAEMADKTLFSVESDMDWLAGMQRYFTANPPRATLHLLHGNVGPTKGWGEPQSGRSFRKWPGYPLGIWDLPEFVHPDVVLIDGRFRAACFLTTLFRITRPVTVLWDDYSNRAAYHEVERLVEPAAMIGRMARFQLQPTPIAAEHLTWIIETYLRPL